jgi:hypothetical protein
MNARSNGKPIDWKRVGVIAVVLLIAGYQYSHPTLEKWLGRSLPSLSSEQDTQQAQQDSSSQSRANDSRYDAKLPTATEPRSNQSSAGASASNAESQTFLRSIGRDNLQSPAGLIYGMGPRREHRVDHVMRHARDMPNRPVHSVFDGDKNSILRLLDEAYELVKSDSDQVRSFNSRGNDEHTIRMNRQVGYEGGQKGKRKGYPTLRNVKLILDGNRVITAYPSR